MKYQPFNLYRPLWNAQKQKKNIFSISSNLTRLRDPGDNIGLEEKRSKKKALTHFQERQMGLKLILDERVGRFLVSAYFIPALIQTQNI